MDRDTVPKSRGNEPSPDEQEIDQCSHNASHGSEQHFCDPRDVPSVVTEGDCNESPNQALFNGIGSQFTEKKC